MTNLHPLIWLTIFLQLVDGNGFIQRDIIFMIDVSATVGTSGVTASITLFKDIAKNYQIFDDTVRIGAVAFHDSTVLLFDLNTYDNYEDIASGLETAAYVGGNGDIGIALDFVRLRYTGGNNGDRTTVADIMIMITDGISLNMLTAGTDANNAGWEIHIIGVTPSAFPIYIDQVADYAYYTNTYSDMYSTVYTSVRDNLPSTSACSSLWIRYDEPGNLISSTDTSSSTGYLLLDDTFKVTCCGVINRWSFYAVTSGDINFQVWRPSGSSYSLVGQNSYTVSGSEIGTTVSYTVPSGQMIAIQENDRIGWYCSGINVIPYASCTTAARGNCPQNNKRSVMASPSTGSLVDWSTASSVSNAAYAINWYTGNNTAPTFSPTVTSTRISDITPIGTSVLPSAFTDLDVGDSLTYNLTDTYFEIDTSGIIRLKSVLPTSATDVVSTLTITVTDACDQSTTGTVTVTSYNVPPNFGGLPSTVTLSEDTTTETKLKDLDVSADAICCTLSNTVPSTTVFSLVNSGGYTLYYAAGNSLDADYAMKYTLYVCCDDGLASNTSFLTVYIKAISVKTTTEIPSFVTTGLLVCLIPIGLLFGLSCALLVVTVWIRQ